MKLPWCISLCACVLLLSGTVKGKRFSGSRRGGSSSKHRVPSPPPPPSHSSNHGGGSGGGSSGTFLNAERGGTGNTHFGSPAPAPGYHPPSNGPVGFEKFGNQGGNQGHQIGFDKVNSQSNKPNAYNPSAPPAPVGPPPAYPGTHSGGHYGGSDHPPAYPGRPVNAPPAYTPNAPHYPQQQFGNGFPHQSQYGNPGYGGFGNSPYPGNFPVGGASFGGNAFGGGGGHHPSYQGNSYGGSPFGGGGYNGNPYYSPNNFGYSNNPGYFGGAGGYPGQYGYQQKSRFGGLGGLPIPIPIPIPLGGFGGFGGFGGGHGGYGGYGGHHSYNHRVLDTFISSNNTAATSNSTSIFLLNNNTVAPCTSDHFVYDKVKLSTLACTAQACTAVKVVTTTSLSGIDKEHGGSVTLCLEGDKATVSSHGDIIMPTVSPVVQETVTVCRNVSANATTANTTNTAEGTTVAPDTTTVNTTVCEKVNCSSVEMCTPAVEVVDPCPKEPCPFRRTGYKPCVVVKMCSSPSAPISTFASLNTTISKIDEYNKYTSMTDFHNLTLISYHPPVIPMFNTTAVNATSTSSTPAPGT